MSKQKIGVIVQLAGAGCIIAAIVMLPNPVTALALGGSFALYVGDRLRKSELF